MSISISLADFSCARAAGKKVSSRRCYRRCRHAPLRGPGSYGFVAEALALSGHREEALAALDGVLELSKRQHVPAFDIAGIYAALDDVDNMFLWLEARPLDDSSPVGSLPPRTFVRQIPRRSALRQPGGADTKLTPSPSG